MSSGKNVHPRKRIYSGSEPCRGTALPRNEPAFFPAYDDGYLKHLKQKGKQKFQRQETRNRERRHPKAAMRKLRLKPIMQKTRRTFAETDTTLTACLSCTMTKMTKPQTRIEAGLVDCEELISRLVK